MDQKRVRWPRSSWEVFPNIRQSLNNFVTSISSLALQTIKPFVRPINDARCPLCKMDEFLIHEDRLECVTRSHEWDKPEEARVVKDARGNVLVTVNVVAMVKDLKLKGNSKVLKASMKSKPIRIVDDDHEIDCKMDGMAIAL